MVNILKLFCKFGAISSSFSYFIGPDTRYNLGYDLLDTIHWIQLSAIHGAIYDIQDCGYESSNWTKIKRIHMQIYRIERSIRSRNDPPVPLSILRKDHWKGMWTTRQHQGEYRGNHLQGTGFVPEPGQNRFATNLLKQGLSTRIYTLLLYLISHQYCPSP